MVVASMRSGKPKKKTKFCTNAMKYFWIQKLKKGYCVSSSPFFEIVKINSESPRIGIRSEPVQNDNNFLLSSIGSSCAISQKN